MRRTIMLCCAVCVALNAYALHPVTGPSSCCVGTSVRLQNADPGGLWASSNSAVALVASDGTVTGISAGTATITYTLGKESATFTLAVHGKPDAGLIQGEENIEIGRTATFMNANATGEKHYWTSCSPEIASVNYRTGAVTGVSAGATTVTYSALECGEWAYTTHAVYVTPKDCITGHVTFGGGFNGKVKVALIHYNPVTKTARVVDSTIYTCTDSVVYYQFTNIPTDSFRVRASVCDTTTYRYGFMSTYHSRNYYWQNANVIYHISGTADQNIDISMIYGRFEH